jgi:hypothetical protein
MQIEEPERERKRKRLAAYGGPVVEVLVLPVLVAGAVLAVPFGFLTRWTREHREHKLRMLMKSRGRLITWTELLRAMREKGGTCIEERFSPKGPVRFWWTPENVYRESPYEIIDWFTMRKGRAAEPFIRWCRERYTSAEAGSAVLVDTPFVPRREIYRLWAECRSDAAMAKWVEVAPPEIVPHQPGE